MLLFEWASRIETVGDKLAEGKGLREGRDSKELWKSVDKSTLPNVELSRRASAPRFRIAEWKGVFDKAPGSRAIIPRRTYLDASRRDTCQ